jgi:hypothetical protein
MRTFGHYLQLFAKSVDVVDEHTFERVRSLFQSYVKNELQVAYFELVAGHVVDGERRIETRWSSEGQKASKPVLTDEGRYRSHVALAYDRNVPLWIVNPDRRPLQEAETYRDLWSNFPDLPAYVHPPVHQPIRTTIAMPLWNEGRVVGALDLEATPYLEITEVVKAELKLLAGFLGTLLDRRESSRSQSAGTQAAVDMLHEVLQSGALPKLAKPRVFVASSSRADEKVVLAIREVLAGFGDKVSVVEWSDLAESGTVTLQIVRAVVGSRFGICYLSEPAPRKGKFQDNANVIFEAGMLHALVNTPGNIPMAWIPVRERESPPAPFDFATERIETVPRAEDGSLDEERLKARLGSRISHLLDGDE